jgi:hypothetical protein
MVMLVASQDLKAGGDVTGKDIPEYAKLPDDEGHEECDSRNGRWRTKINAIKGSKMDSSEDEGIAPPDG